MTTAGPWSVKGIDPKAREIAKDLARRSGLTLGEWLNQMIVEGADESESSAPTAGAQALAKPRNWDGAAPRANAAAAAKAPGAVLNAESFRSRLREAGRGAEAGETSRIARALSELTAKVEAAENRSTLAISGIDQQAMGVLSRLEGVEKEQSATAGEQAEAIKALEGAVAKVASQSYEADSRARAQGAEVREDLIALARRLDRADADGGRTLDTASLDAAIAKLAERMDEAQRRTGTAVRALEASFAGLDQRLARAEAPPEALAEAPEADGRLERLAAELSEKVESARAEMTAGLRDAADGKLDRMEAALRDLSGQVAESEKRSAGAIDRMGREVVRIAQGLNGRMGEVERRSHSVAEQVGGEIGRIADAVENRLARADTQQAQALEKLGGEIARIAERLADRIAAAERRGAEDLTRGLDEVGEQFTRVTDKLNSRYDHAAADLAERIRASEERTQRLLDEAHARIEARGRQAVMESETAHALAEMEAPGFHEVAFPTEPLPEEAQEPEPAFPAAHAFAAPEPTAPSASEEIDLFESAYAPGPFGRPHAPEPHDSFQAAEEGGFEADDAFLASPFQSTPAPAAEPARPNSTRELIEQARAAARASAESRGRRGGRPPVPGRTAEAPGAEVFSVPAPGFEEGAPADTAPEPRRLFGFPRLRKRENSTLKTAFTASGRGGLHERVGARRHLDDGRIGRSRIDHHRGAHRCAASHHGRRRHARPARRRHHTRRRPDAGPRPPRRPRPGPRSAGRSLGRAGALWRRGAPARAGRSGRRHSAAPSRRAGPAGRAVPSGQAL